MGYCGGTVADGRFDLNITSFPVRTHRTHGILFGSSPAVKCRFPFIPKPKGTINPREDGLARDCPPVSHSENNEEGSDDLFVNTIKRRRFKLAVCQEEVQVVRT